MLTKNPSSLELHREFYEIGTRYLALLAEKPGAVVYTVVIMGFFVMVRAFLLSGLKMMYSF